MAGIVDFIELSISQDAPDPPRTDIFSVESIRRVQRHPVYGATCIIWIADGPTRGISVRHDYDALKKALMVRSMK
jgi:hypothetical protein